MSRATHRTRLVSHRVVKSAQRRREWHPPISAPRCSRGRASRVEDTPVRPPRRWLFFGRPAAVTPAANNHHGATATGERPTAATEPLQSFPTAENPAAGKALRLWLQWNESYEQATSRLYAAGQNPARIEELLDRLDEQRREAVRLTRQAVT